MRFNARIRPTPTVLGLVAVLTASAGFNANAQELIYGISDQLNLLVGFSSAAPSTLKSAISITGLASGEQIRAIDFIGTTLYGLGSENHLYTINTTTGAVTPVGSAFSPVLNGVNFGLAQTSPSGPLSLYVASDLGQNLTLNGTTGTATAGPSYTGASLNSFAYDYINNTYIGVSATTHNLYGVSPTTGAETLIGSTGISFLANVGLTVSPSFGAAYFSSTIGSQSGFYDLNPTTGALSFVGDVGTPGQFTSGLNSITATGIPVVPEPASAALLALGGGFGLLLFRRKK